MPKYLFIAEKPSLARDINTAYKTLSAPAYAADFIPLRGHFMELQEPDAYTPDWGKPYRKEVLPMIPDKFKYQIKSGVSKDYNNIKNLLLSGNYDCVINACDAGREGEAIFWSLYNHIGVKLPVKRLWASDTTVETLSKALENLFDYSPNSMFVNLRDSSLCRMEFDWLVGMNLSRAAMLTTKKALSVGRVKSPTLNIVVTRDLEIAKFQAKDFFEIEADFDGYKGYWFKDNKTSFENKEDANKLVKSLSKNAVITEVKEEKITNYAPPLYSLAELQKEANRIFGFTAAETLDIAQSLYETHKILSYPRTEARVLSTAMGKEIPALLKAIKDVPDVSKQVAFILANPNRITDVCNNKKYVDNKKVTDHHALVNTKVVPNLTKLSEKEKKLYILVIKKFVSIFLDPQVVSKTTIITNIDKETFKTTGSTILDKGFKELYSGLEKEDIKDELPKVKQGEKRNVNTIKILGKKTQPPKPYTDSSLLDAMQHAGKFVDDDAMKEILDDTKGIGTSATRAAIIDGLISKNFFYRKGKTIRATDFGIESIKALEGKDIISPILTAKWEEALRDIEDGSISDVDFRKKMKNFIIDETKSFLSSLSTMDNKKVVGECPVCHSRVIEGNNYFLCENYKKEANPCDFIFSKTISGQIIKTEECQEILKGKETKEKKFKSQNGKTFYASLGLIDECLGDGSIKKKVSLIFSNGKSIGRCPRCGGNIIDKSGSFACEEEDCGFFISKTLKGTTITESDVKNLIGGKSTATKKFFSGKKPWYAKLKYSDNFTKLNFEFQKND